MPEAVQKQAERELARFEKMGESNAEASMIRTYLDWLLAVPWSKRSEERLDPKYAREVLDAESAPAARPTSGASCLRRSCACRTRL